MRALVAARRCPIAALIWLAAGFGAAPAGAHPLGNNTVSRQAEFAVAADRLSLTYRMDFAEIPTLAAADAADDDGDGRTGDAEWQRYAQRWSRDLAAALELAGDGRPLRLRVEDVRYRLRDGDAGLSVLGLEARYTAALPTVRTDRAYAIRYRDRFRPGDNGWKEILVRGGDGQRIGGDVARVDRSHGLTRYPTDGTMPQELAAAFDIALPAPAATDSAGPAALAEAAPQPPALADAPVAAAAIPADGGNRPPLAGASLSAYFVLGMHHIATGWDHLAFLLGLLLLSPRLREVIKLVTAFTVAHSATLLLAAGHWLSPPGQWVEPAIAFTIAYVGALALTRRAGGHGAVLAFGFGLVHGFGFAGALAETLGAAAREPGWLLKLLAFNVGIEAFQVVIVVLALLVAAPLRGVRWRTTAHAAASAGVFVCGMGWLVLRVVSPGVY